MPLPTNEYLMHKEHEWDKYFLSVCEIVGSHSKCLSRKIGALIVRDRSILSTGYNGPPRGVPLCAQRLTTTDEKDPLFNQPIKDEELNCPRRLLGYASGQGLEYCTAAHAERNCIANAARSGTCTNGAYLYLNTVLPCKDCMAEIINAGIRIVVCYPGEYDRLSGWMAKHAKVQVRRFEP